MSISLRFEYTVIDVVLPRFAIELSSMTLLYVTANRQRSNDIALIAFEEDGRGAVCSRNKTGDLSLTPGGGNSPALWDLTWRFQWQRTPYGP